MLQALRSRARRKRTAAQLFESLSHRARAPVFFREYGVPDSFDGRFDLLVLHAWMVLDQLQARREGALAQSLVDAVFAGLDGALREQGVSDMGLGRRMKRMAGAFYGRLGAYENASGEDGLAAALVRNVYRGERVVQAARLAKYVLAARAGLATCRLEHGELEFGPPAEILP